MKFYSKKRDQSHNIRQRLSYVQAGSANQSALDNQVQRIRAQTRSTQGNLAQHLWLWCPASTLKLRTSQKEDFQQDDLQKLIVALVRRVLSDPHNAKLIQGLQDSRYNEHTFLGEDAKEENSITKEALTASSCGFCRRKYNAHIVLAALLLEFCIVDAEQFSQ